MFRKHLIPMLLDREMTVNEISRVTEQKGKTTVEDLEHLLKSLKHTSYQAVITPASCRKCGFEFGTDKLRKPSKCPKCKGDWISEPRIKIVEPNSARSNLKRSAKIGLLSAALWPYVDPA